jgi:hypothetical protein
MKICRPSGPFCRILVLVGEAEPGRCEKIAVHSEAGRMVQEPVRFGVFCFGQKIATVAGDRDNNIAF